MFVLVQLHVCYQRDTESRELTLDVRHEGILGTKECLKDFEVVALEVVTSNLNSFLVAKAIAQNVLAVLIIYFLCSL